MDNELNKNRFQRALTILQSVNHYEFETLDQIAEYFGIIRKIENFLLTFEEQ